MNNTRFATEIHILTLLAYEKGQWLSSDKIAGSININPVIVRKELSVLHEAGLVVSCKGKEGGSRLGRECSKIFLSDIYRIVKNSEVLGKKNSHTNPKCPVGRQINDNLERLFRQADERIVNFLEGISLEDFVRQFA